MNITEEVVKRFAALFPSAAPTHYIADFTNVKVGERGKVKPDYVNVKRALGLSDYQAHLEGRKGLLIVPVDREGYAAFGVIDVDIYDIDGAEVARKVLAMHLPLIVLLSKSGGLHLLYPGPRMLASELRAHLKQWAVALDFAGCEIFPKQDRLEEGDTGNGINLPYFGHTGNVLINSKGQKADEVLLFLGRVDKVRSVAIPDLQIERAAQVLAEVWNKKGPDGEARHNLTVEVAGALFRHNWERERIKALIERTVVLTGDDEPRERVKAVAAAERSLRKGRKVPGIPSLVEHIGREATDALLEACGVTTAAESPSGASLDDFRAYLPAHEYIYLPTGEMWPGSSVNSQIPPPVPRGKKKAITASNWLDQHHPVHQITWSPGDPQIIEGKLVAAGGWIEREGVATFNLYRPPAMKGGDPRGARPWLRAMCMVWPRYARRHIISYLAHRVQRPGEKINHALVLGGEPGIGKDTVLEPVKYGVGHWNFKEVSPQNLLGRFNGFLKSVVLRVSEVRDLGEINRYALYEHMKTITAAPPDVHRCDEKNLKEHEVFNVCGVIITTNHRSGGIYLPANDRRHFVAWSEKTETDSSTANVKALWSWYAKGGIEDVVAYLHSYDLSDWDPKAPPPKTEAFWEIVNAEMAPESAELADVLEKLGSPVVITLEQLSDTAQGMTNSTADRDRSELVAWLTDRRNRRQIPHRLREAGYVPVRNSTAPKDGLFKIGGRRQVVYGKAELTESERIKAAEELQKQPRYAEIPGA